MEVEKKPEEKCINCGSSSSKEFLWPVCSGYCFFEWIDKRDHTGRTLLDLRRGNLLRRRGNSSR
jgi:hypothetical protein